MENKTLKCLEIIINVIENYCKETDIMIDVIDETTRLIGSTSPFDSMDLVQIIVEVEDKINEEFHSEIILTDEKAMSRSTSPFIKVGTLSKFIIEILN